MNYRVETTSESLGRVKSRHQSKVLLTNKDHITQRERRWSCLVYGVINRGGTGLFVFDSLDVWT